MRERNGTLHHRFPRQDEVEQLAPPSASKRKRSSKMMQKRKISWIKPSLRIFGVFVLILYLVIYYSVLLQPSTENAVETGLSVPSERQMLVRHIIDQQEWSDQQDVLSRIHEARTRPTPPQKALSISWHASGHGTSLRLVDDQFKTASIESICGFIARNASLHGKNYFERDTLTSSSRVLITNILHPVAFSLAVQISRECQAQIVAAFDRIRDPMESQEMLSLLVSQDIVPDSRRIMPAYLGLDTTSKSRPPLLWTGQSDILQYKPTHIVHFGLDETPSVNIVQMEQLLQSIAGSDIRPHFLYAASTKDYNQSQVLADSYFTANLVEATGLRLPDTVYGPWCNSSVDIMLRDLIQNRSVVPTTKEPAATPVYLRDAVDGLVAAMQYRSPTRAPTVLTLSPRDEYSMSELILESKNLISGGKVSLVNTTMVADPSPLGWSQRTSLQEGLLRTYVWNLDQQGVTTISSPENITGDELLISHSLDPCHKMEETCHVFRTKLPCSAECALKTYCESSILDDLITLTRELSEGCDIILYTQSLYDNTRDLTMQAEYEDEGSPMICNFAFVSSMSPLVELSVKQVPNEELVRLDAVPQPEDGDDPAMLHARIRDKLNGRLLYRGWILVWPNGSLDGIRLSERYLLKLSPGRFFHSDVKHALFVSQIFPVTPSLDDIRFLVETMSREAQPARGKRKSDMDPPVKIRAPPEPPRKAGILMSVLRFEDSPDYRPLPEDTVISIKEASMFMRYEKGDHELEGEPLEIRRQRDYYERFMLHMNKVSWIKAQSGPSYHFRIHHWASTRWVLHDMHADEVRKFRCEWYNEHIKWGTNIDQLSFAFVMAKHEVIRRERYNEMDDFDLTRVEGLLEYRRMVSDANEWHPLGDFPLPQYELDVQIYPVDLEMFHVLRDAPSYPANETRRLYARIISDRAMSLERRAWSKIHQPKPSS